MASFRDDAIQLFEGLKQRNLRVIKNCLVGLIGDIKRAFIYSYKYKHCVFICLGTAVAFPVTIGLTPISIITDIFAGIIQASVRLCQGAGKDEILSILHKKVIASPVQQSTYLIINSIALSAISGAAFIFLFTWSWGRIQPVPALVYPLVISALKGDILYSGSQRIIAQLPRFFRPDGYNVFIGGGAVDRFGNKIDFDPETTYSKWRDRAYEQKAHTSSSQPNEESDSSSHRSYKFSSKTSGVYISSPADRARKAFTNTRMKVQKDLNELTDVQSEDQFKKIKTWFKNDEDTYKLFGFSSSDEVTIEKLKKAYRSLTLKCHPDKVCDNEKKEAAIWFTLLNEARLNIEEYILRSRA